MSRQTMTDLNDVIYHLDDMRNVMEAALDRINELEKENERLSEQLLDYERRTGDYYE